MLQYMDKLALSQATLFNLAEDLVCILLSRYFYHASYHIKLTLILLLHHRIYKELNIIGHPLSSTLATLRGVGRVAI